MHGLKISFEIIIGDITGISGAKFIANVIIILCFQVTGYYVILYHACTCTIVSMLLCMPLTQVQGSRFLACFS